MPNNIVVPFFDGVFTPYDTCDGYHVLGICNTFGSTSWTVMQGYLSELRTQNSELRTQKE